MDKRISSLIKIGIIGDYDNELISHKATNEALKHCADALNIKLEARWIPTEFLETDVNNKLHDFHGLLCSPGSPYKSRKGALNGIRFARENNYPFIGTCGGFQHAVIEYLTNKLNINYLNDDKETDLFITPLSCSLIGETRKILINKNSKVYDYYKKEEIIEKYNCNFGINSKYEKLLEESGFKIVGTDFNSEARILEIPEMTFYIATLFQPQLSSKSEKPHKLIIRFLQAAQNFQSPKENISSTHIKENIRHMRIDNYDDVYKIWDKTPGIGISSADSKEAIKSYLERNPNLSYIYCKDNKIVGTILCGYDGRRGFIHHTCVIPEYQGKGIGKLLVEKALQSLKDKGIDKCHIFVFADNEKGQEFWNKLDWTKRDDILIYSKSQ